MMKHSTRLLTALTLGVLLLFLSSCQREPPKTQGEVKDEGALRIYAFDVGQGDGLLVISPGGKHVLIDAGPSEAEHELVASLKKLGIKDLDLVVATHPHADHIGGMRWVLDNFPVKKFLDSGQTYSSVTYEKMLQEIKAKRIGFIEAQKGQNLELDSGVKFEVINPSRPLITHVRSGGSIQNANSVVMRLSYGDFAMLFTGDAEFETEDRLMEAGSTLTATVLKVGHHGSRHATSLEFLNRVHPQAAVISAGANNDYGHPSQETLDRFRQDKIEVWRTDLHGELMILSDGKKYEIRSARQPAPAEVWQGREPSHAELRINLESKPTTSGQAAVRYGERERPGAGESGSFRRHQVAPAQWH